MAHGHWLKDYIGPKASESGGVGYSCTKDWVTLTDESVTTTKAEESTPAAFAVLAYSEIIEADSIKVIFDGEEYICEKRSSTEGEYEYGASFNLETYSYDWSEYPFNIHPFSDDSIVSNQVDTENAGTYQVKIEAFGISVTVTPCFERAVKSVIGSSSKFVVTFTNDGSTYTADRTFAEVIEAYNSGKVVEGAFKKNAEGETITSVCTLVHIEGTSVRFIGVDDVVRATDADEPYIGVFKFMLNENNTVEYNSYTIHSSN